MLPAMYEYMTMLTKTQTEDMEAHKVKVQQELFLPATQGWQLVSTDTVIRGAHTETLTFWQRSGEPTEPGGAS